MLVHKIGWIRCDKQHWEARSKKTALAKSVPTIFCCDWFSPGYKYVEMKTCVSQFLSSRSWRFWSSWLPAFSAPIHDLEMIVFLSRSIFGSQKQNVCKKKKECVERPNERHFWLLFVTLKLMQRRQWTGPGCSVESFFIRWVALSTFWTTGACSLLTTLAKTLMLLWSCISTFWLSSN